MTEIRRRPVSVIIPCYRQAEYLPASIESVLTQTHGCVELIVVNDGSDDDTEQVVRRYGTRVTYVHKTNGGLSSARNAGLAAATGHFVMFLDADDLLHPEALARLTDAAGQEGECMVIMGTEFFSDDPSVSLPGPIVPERMSSLLPRTFVNNRPVHAHLCPRAAIVQAGLFNENLWANEDWDLWLRLGLNGIRVRTMEWCGAYYRRHHTSMSTDRARMAHSKVEMFLGLWPRLEKRPEFWSDWAPAFLRSLYAFRRQCRVLGLREDERQINELVTIIRARGIRVEPQSPLVVKIQDRLPAPMSDLFESTLILACRMLRPSLYDSLSR